MLYEQKWWYEIFLCLVKSHAFEMKNNYNMTRKTNRHKEIQLLKIKI